MKADEESRAMRTGFLLAATVAAIVLLSGCPLRQDSPTTEALEPQPTADRDSPQATEVTDVGATDAGHPALRRSRPEDGVVLEAILAYLEEAREDQKAAGLETADWVAYQDVMEKDLTPDQVGKDAMVYKIVEEDAWLSVLFGPPFSEFYLEFRLAPSDDGALEVIGCDFLSQPGEE